MSDIATNDSDVREDITRRAAWAGDLIMFANRRRIPADELSVLCAMVAGSFIGTHSRDRGGDADDLQDGLEMLARITTKSAAMSHGGVSPVRRYQVDDPASAPDVLALSATEVLQGFDRYLDLMGIRGTSRPPFLAALLGLYVAKHLDRIPPSIANFISRAYHDGADQDADALVDVMVRAERRS